MKIVFIGAVEIGYTILQSVYDSRYDVDTIYTLPFDMQDKTSGFIDFQPLASKNRTTLVRVKDINTTVNINAIKSIKPDLIIVAGWQRLVCKEILNIPKFGTIGFHSSLLPKYRGRAPVNWAIIMGEKETGITMFYLTPEADDGDIIAQKSFPILLNDNCKTVYDKAAFAGGELIKSYLPQLEVNNAPRLHNVSGTYPHYPKRTPKDGLIDFNRSALDIYNFVRALTKPYPGAYYFNNSGDKIVVWSVEIVFDESRLLNNDIVFETLDLKIRILKYEKSV